MVPPAWLQSDLPLATRMMMMYPNTAFLDADLPDFLIPRADRSLSWPLSLLSSFLVVTMNSLLSLCYNYSSNVWSSSGRTV